ncbi:FAD-dependent oxidoreductase [Craterilacuibacter sp.]|uniref:FAD-dependent oxidoreductase n=1 Tax=Craterilacuibacter sp. TaxID=2870909 RepID=UPI003F3A36EB
MAGIAVIGGGINGVMSAWELARAGHCVTLFERDTLISHTSRTSSKLLHGGLRYLENGEIPLVRRALADRDWWLTQNSKLVHPLAITLPVYRQARRKRWQLKAGLWLYDRLAGTSALPPHQWLTRQSLLSSKDHLHAQGLQGGYRYFDAQMDDEKLGNWAAGQARLAGVVIREHAPISRIACDGSVYCSGQILKFDAVVNATGPWAARLLTDSTIPCAFALDTVRGSHLLLARPLSQGYLLEVAGERRVVFVLPWQGQTLVGTTEIRQTPDTPVQCSDAETRYLLALYNHYFPAASENEISGSYAGLRPLLKSHRDPNRAQREHALIRHGCLLTVFGGKWTTSPSLAREVAVQVQAMLAP